MLRKIRVMLEYDTYCLWLYNERGEIIGNDNPPEWLDDMELMALYSGITEGVENDPTDQLNRMLNLPLEII